MKKNPVHTLNNQSDELFDFDIFSITSTESVYRVVHLLNSELAIDLEQADLLDFKLKNDEEFYFPLYSFLHPDLNLEFHLLPNQTTFQPPHHNKDNFDLFGGNVEQNARLISELENTDPIIFPIFKSDSFKRLRLGSGGGTSRGVGVRSSNALASSTAALPSSAA